MSGRVSATNYLRDIHREHMTGVCAISGDTFREKLSFVRNVFSLLKGYKFEKEKNITKRILQKRHAITETMRLFEVDHIDGNPYNNDPENLQTLTREAHKLKSMLCGDFGNRH